MDLEAIFHELNALHFRAELPEPRLEWNSRLSSTAGRFAPGRLVRGREALPLIQVATYLIEIPDGETHIRDTVLHEMIHYWLWFEGKPYGHTPEFIAKMKATGAKRFNPVPKQRPIKYHYQCPNCRILVPARMRLNNVACKACCTKFNGGEFSRRFRLELAAAPETEVFPCPELDEEDEKIAAAAEIEKFVLPFDKALERLEALRELVKNAIIKTSPKL